ncbi:MAG: ABC transporter ATP-binding protein [Gammaproteobacteria bacterium]|nr:MAG: ABC transporter ATP-binding protein [Gammaproteobacteria bacterium]
MLELRDLVLKPGARPINHRFSAGSITVVLGRNHSGKTLFCRTLAGLDEPVAGEIELEGEPLMGVGPGERSVALVYQAFVNYPNWTVFQNIASPLIAAGERKDAIEVRVRDIAGRLGLKDLFDRYPEALSGGQQQRLAIGRALAKNARLLVLDEPLVNLDFKLRERLQLELTELLEGLDLAVLYTSSDPRDAFALGDELLLMADHSVLQSGTPLEVYRSPVSLAAADLMSDPRVNRLPDAGGVLRPEHLSLVRGGEADLAFDVEVIGSETNGSETFLHCRPDGLGEASEWVARLEGLVRLSPGDRTWLYAPPANLMTFVDDRPRGPARSETGNG